MSPLISSVNAHSKSLEPDMKASQSYLLDTNYYSANDPSSFPPDIQLPPTS